MGTSGAWGGSGDVAAKSLRDTVSTVGVGSGGASSPTVDGGPGLDADDLRDAVRLLDKRTASSSSGPSGSRVAAGSARRSSRAGGGGRAGGGASRSTGRTASTAGRAIAGAIAYRVGDRATLRRLGLDLDALVALGDPFEVIRRIVDMACGSADSTIADHERRLMAADVSEQLVVDLDLTAGVPTERIVELAVATIVAELTLSECGDILLSSDGTVTEQDVRDSADAIVSRTTFEVAGMTEGDFAESIEAGLATLRKILGIDE